MSAVAPRPLPKLDNLNRAFWTGGADGVLRFQRCQDCGHWLHPPGVICPKCLSEKLVQEAVSGFGTIEALTINCQPWLPGQKVPYAIAIIGLDEQPGLRLTSNVVGAAPESLSIGQRVQVFFEACEDVYLPMFKLA
jgi:uncharacterized OB-fold protein